MTGHNASLVAKDFVFTTEGYCYSPITTSTGQRNTKYTRSKQAHYWRNFKRYCLALSTTRNSMLLMITS